MLLQGARQSLPRAASPRNLSNHSRSIHIPRRITAPPFSPSNFILRTRRFLAQLTTNVLGQGLPVSRSVHSSPSIRQSLSLPARVALSRPLGSPCLPRAPYVPRHVAEVGLGTAKRFSTGRPIFQHIVENVPVAGRAFYEVDWNLKKREEENGMTRRSGKKGHHKVKIADKLAPVPAPIITPLSAIADEAQSYFQSPPNPLVITYLQIPLAPTPTARVPLSTTPRLLPLPALAKEHASHSKHAIRVSSLFRRLDAAEVWKRGATCETGGDPSGLCTILRVRFEGWSAQDVKQILGDAGKDWCTLEEIREPPVGAISDSQDFLVAEWAPATSTDSIPSVECGLSSPISFVMPTLDFSSSFMAATSSPSPSSPCFTRPSSPLTFSDEASDNSFHSVPASVRDDDSISNASFSSLSDTSSDESSVSDSFSDGGWLGFSADFSAKSFQLHTSV